MHGKFIQTTEFESFLSFFATDFECNILVLLQLKVNTLFSHLSSLKPGQKCNIALSYRKKGNLSCPCGLRYRASTTNH